MKTLYILILVLFSKNAIAQSKNSLYIYDSSSPIGHIRLIEYPDIKVVFNEYKYYVDSAENHKGDYLTIFTFQQFGTVVNRVIILTFDKPVKSCELKCPHGVSHIITTFNKEKTEYKFIINELKTNKFSFITYSKEEVYTKIDEVSKYIKR